MLGFLKIQPLELSDSSNYTVVELITSIFSYFKGITVFDSILPKDVNAKDGKKELFPTKLNYESDLLKRSTAVPCSTMQQPVFKMENNDNVITWSFDEEHHHIKNPRIPDLPNPEFFDIDLLNNQTSTESELSISPATSNSSFDNEKESKKSNVSYPCEFCGAEFKIRGYLTRHIKKHALNKAYECPFYDEHSDNKCHPNGGFSRRDTYKTHLKARHFKYPKGTRSLNRSTTPGHCASCLKPFSNNEEWVEKHIENGECTGLPEDYEVRGKNTRRKRYEFPTNKTATGINSPISMTSNSPELPNTQQPQQSTIQHNHHHHQITSNQSPLSNHSMNEKPVFEDYHAFDDDDEYSLDVEQCLTYRPISY